MNITGLNLIRLNNALPIEFPIIGATPTNKFILKAVDGLGPPEVDVSISDPTYGAPGYQGRRPQRREIVMRVGLNPDWSINQNPADLRDILYTLLSPGVGDMIRILLMNDSSVAAVTEGYVKKIEMTAFAKDPEAQITIACKSAYLWAQDRTYVDLTGLSKNYPQIYNGGTAPTGLHAEMTYTADYEGEQSFKFSAIDFGGTKSVWFKETLKLGDKLIIDTRPGFYEVSRTRNDVKKNLLYALQGDSAWISLYPGANSLSITHGSFDWDVFFFTENFWGI